MNILRPQFTKHGQGLQRNLIAEKGAPVAFGAEILNLTLAHKTAVLNSQALQAGYRTPYYIDEIRITAYGGVVESIANGIAYGLRAQFQTGRHAFSKEPIPLSMYAPVFLRAGYNTTYTSGADTLHRPVVEVRWPLPKPLYMEAGDVIQCYIERSNSINIGPNFETNNFNVTYVGRALAPGKTPPPCKYVPWVSFYDHLTSNTVGYSNAREAFRNPFTIPLHVHRLTQHTYGNFSLDGTDWFETTSSNPTNIEFGNTFTSIRMYDSLGYAIVKEFTPIGEVMDMSRHAWTFSRPLGPREQFEVAFSAPLTQLAGFQYATLLGMVAHREEEI